MKSDISLSGLFNILESQLSSKVTEGEIFSPALSAGVALTKRNKAVTASHPRMLLGCLPMSRHHDRIARFQEVVSLAAVIDDVIIIDFPDFLLAPLVPDNLDAAPGCEFRKSARQGKSLEHGHLAAQ